MFPRQIFGNALFRDSDAVNFDTFMVLGMGMVRFHPTPQDVPKKPFLAFG